jgi:hypothetical protein
MLLLSHRTYKLRWAYFSPIAGWALHFCLNAKTKQKNQGSQINTILIFTKPKCGRVILEQSSKLPGLTKVLLHLKWYLFVGQKHFCGYYYQNLQNIR